MTTTGSDKAGSDNGGYERDVAKFADNADGTTSLKEFLEQVGRLLRHHVIASWIDMLF